MFSALLRSPREGYPTPARSQTNPYGLPRLEARRQLQVHRETARVAKQFLLWNVAIIATGGKFVGFLVERPANPNNYRNHQEDGEKIIYPSMWNLDLWIKEFQRLFGMKRLDVDQGAMGHRAVKPTSTGANYQALEDIHGMRAQWREKGPATSLSSVELARWAP